MDDANNQKAITKLRMEYADLMQENVECDKRDDIFEIKRKVLKRIREVEHEIDQLVNEGIDSHKTSGNY